MKCIIKGCEREADTVEFEGVEVNMCAQCRYAFYTGVNVATGMMAKEIKGFTDKFTKVMKSISDEERGLERKEE